MSLFSTTFLPCGPIKKMPLPAGRKERAFPIMLFHGRPERASTFIAGGARKPSRHGRRIGRAHGNPVPARALGMVEKGVGAPGGTLDFRPALLRGGVPSPGLPYQRHTFFMVHMPVPRSQASVIGLKQAGPIFPFSQKVKRKPKRPPSVFGKGSVISIESYISSVISK